MCGPPVSGEEPAAPLCRRPPPLRARLGHSQRPASRPRPSPDHPHRQRSWPRPSGPRQPGFPGAGPPGRQTPAASAPAQTEPCPATPSFPHPSPLLALAALPASLSCWLGKGVPLLPRMFLKVSWQPWTPSTRARPPPHCRQGHGWGAHGRRSPLRVTIFLSGWMSNTFGTFVSQKITRGLTEKPFLLESFLHTFHKNDSTLSRLVCTFYRSNAHLGDFASFFHRLHCSLPSRCAGVHLTGPCCQAARSLPAFSHYEQSCKE